MFSPTGSGRAMMLSVDPSVRSTGCALWENGVLVQAWLERGQGGSDAWCRIADAIRLEIQPHWPLSFVCEWPQIYRAGKSKADPNDMLMIAGLVGAIAAVFTLGPILVLPTAWKGQLEKAECARRVMDRLSPEEQKRVTKDDHNVMDSVGLGLWHLGRFDRKRVVAR